MGVDRAGFGGDLSEVLAETVFGMARDCYPPEAAGLPRLEDFRK